MKAGEQATLLRVYLGEKDRWKHGPLYEAIVRKARDLGVAGATVLRGPMGFGASHALHTAKILRLSLDLPVVIEIVDSEEIIQRLLEQLGELLDGKLATTEPVTIVHSSSERTDSQSPD